MRSVPVILLVRGGSKRLPRKALLPWRGTTLLRHAIAQCLECEHVSGVVVATDDDALIQHARGGIFTKDVAGLAYAKIQDSASKTLERFGHKFDTIKRPPVPDDQTSLEGLRWVQDQLGLHASYVMLVQCTAATINAGDLTRLVMTADLPTTEIWALGARGKPSGMAWLVPPWVKTTVPNRFVEQDAALCDIDTLEQYEEARSKWDVS